MRGILPLARFACKYCLGPRGSGNNWEGMGYRMQADFGIYGLDVQPYHACAMDALDDWLSNCEDRNVRGARGDVSTLLNPVLS